MIAEPYIIITGPESGQIFWHRDFDPPVTPICRVYSDFEREKLKELGCNDLRMTGINLIHGQCVNRLGYTVYCKRSNELYLSSDLIGYDWYLQDSESSRLLKRAEFLKAVCEKEGVEWLPKEDLGDRLANTMERDMDHALNWPDCECHKVKAECSHSPCVHSDEANDNCPCKCHKDAPKVDGHKESCDRILRLCEKKGDYRKWSCKCEWDIMTALADHDGGISELQPTIVGGSRRYKAGCKPKEPECKQANVRVYLGNDKTSIIDREDESLVSRFTWHFDGRYAVTDIDGKKLYLHRLLKLPPPGMCIDHANQDKLDNRQSNLFICNKSWNNRNKPKKAGSASRFVGVYWSKPHKKWQARMRSNGRLKSLGYFTNEDDANTAYQSACASLRKRFL